MTYGEHGDLCSQKLNRTHYQLYMSNDQCHLNVSFVSLIHLRVIDYHMEVVIGYDSISRCIAIEIV